MRALVSIGTNSTRLLILDGEQRLAAESRGTRLGAGIAESGTIDAQAQERTLAAIDEYVALVRRNHVEQIDAIATSALRRAQDGATFAHEVAARVGVEPRVLSGEEEASYSFLGATHALDATHPVAVLDVGGGSSELAIDTPAHARTAGRVARVFSVEIGAVRLAERHRALLGERALREDERRALEAEAREDAANVLAPYGKERGFEQLIVVGGTAFTAAGMLAAGTVDGVVITHDATERLIDDLLARALDDRKRMPYIHPQRADILPAGLLIIDEACRLLGVDRFTVSESDLLLGYLTSPAYRAVVARR
ncbi:MAG TPA: hypothetical protein VE591_04345 [Candidatus Acidoferrum sp.]|nr:hypothetical protein [Candidatus Acidoferrum sp.]